MWLSCCFKLNIEIRCTIIPYLALSGNACSNSLDILFEGANRVNVVDSKLADKYALPGEEVVLADIKLDQERVAAVFRKVMTVVKAFLLVSKFHVVK